MYIFALILLMAHIPTCFAEQHIPAKIEKAPTLKRLEEYLDLLPTIKASFSQLNPDGEVVEGILYIDRRNKKLRIEYPLKRQTIVVTDGFLFLHDLNEKDIQEMDASYTPVGLLLQPKIQFNKSVYVQKLDETEKDAHLTLTDNKEGDHGSMTIHFSIDSFIKLTGWKVQDMQGNETHVTIKKLEGNVPLDKKLFLKPTVK